MHHSPQGSNVLLMDDEERKAEIELRERLSRLAGRLPSLVDAPGLDPPMDALALARWAADPLLSPIKRVSAQFVLAVVDPMTIWDCGRLDLDDAGLLWDDEHHRVFSEWSRDYWFVSEYYIPLDMIITYPSFKTMAKERGKSVAYFKKEFSGIFRKLNVRDLAELGRSITIVQLLSRGGTMPVVDA